MHKGYAINGLTLCNFKTLTKNPLAEYVHHITAIALKMYPTKLSKLVTTPNTLIKTNGNKQYPSTDADRIKSIVVSLLINLNK